MIWRLAVFVLVGLWPLQAAVAAPSRIVSINLCTDELLLALADPGQIAALSPYAVDAALTLFADKAAAFRHDAGNAETVVELKPDLVLAGRFSDTATREIVRRVGYDVVEFDVARNIGDAISQIREVAELVGHPERGAVLIGEIEAARGRALASAAGRGSRRGAAFYQRRGYTTGGDTLTGELMDLVGLTNAGRELAGKDGGFVPVEKLIANQPDYLIVDAATIAPEDQGAALLAHPALVALYPPERRIVLPERLTVCGGPSLPQAIDWLSDEVDRVVGPAAGSSG